MVADLPSCDLPAPGPDAHHAAIRGSALLRQHDLSASAIEEVEAGVADSGGRTPFRPDTPRVPTRPCSPTA